MPSPVRIGTLRMCGIGCTMCGVRIVVAAAPPKPIPQATAPPLDTADNKTAPAAASATPPVTAATTAAASCTSPQPLPAFDAVAFCEWQRLALARRGPDMQHSLSVPLFMTTPTTASPAAAAVSPATAPTPAAQLTLTAAVLHMRGTTTAVPAVGAAADAKATAAGACVMPQPQVDSDGSALGWNGEIFGGAVDVAPGHNDTRALLLYLQSHPDIPLPDIMCSIAGPFSFVYWNAKSQTLWFGRDRLGRRSLLIARYGEQVLVSSVRVTAPPSVLAASAASGAAATVAFAQALAALQWEELGTTGVFSIHFPPTALRAAPVTTAIAAHAMAVAAADIPLRHHLWPHTRHAVQQLLQPQSPAPAASAIDLQSCTLSRSTWLTKSVPLFARPAAAVAPTASTAATAASTEVATPAPPDSKTSPTTSAATPGPVDSAILKSPAVTGAAPAVPAVSAAALAPSVQRLLDTLSEAVRVRVQSIAQPLSSPLDTTATTATTSASAPASASVVRRDARIAVLFSGGLDCMVLAALADRHLHADPTEPIDLLTVAFSGDASAPERFVARDVPDRVTAINGVCELQRMAPRRAWRLVEIDVTLQDLEREKARILELLHPRGTIMDFNIGSVLWFGAQGSGRVWTGPRTPIDSPHCRYRHDAFGAAPPAAKPAAAPRQRESEMTAEQRAAKRALHEGKVKRDHKQVKAELRAKALADAKVKSGAATASAGATGEYLAYRSRARVLLNGIGADELFAGYGRHRTVFRAGGAEALARELERDFARLWTRNLGRDDRVASDSGRELRQPFVAESVAALALSGVESGGGLPLAHVCDLTLPPGVGDKRILRAVCAALGLPRTATLEKRAMQFGSRIANNRVAGYVPMNDSVVLREIVNAAFLPPVSAAATTTASAAATAAPSVSKDAAPVTASASSSDEPQTVAASSKKPRTALCKKANRGIDKPGFAADG